MEYPNCNYCGNNKTTLYLKTFDTIYKYDNKEYPYILVECNNCHLVYVNPRPNENDIYKSYGKLNDRNKNLYERKLNRSNAESVHHIVVKDAMNYLDMKNPSLFDMGFGAGTVLTEARKLGLTDVSGNEINTYSCNKLTEQNIKVYNVPTNRLVLDRTFDTITMLDYIEHTYTPMEDLKWCYDHLKNNEILTLKTLYLNCPNHIEQKDKWNLFGAGHHYFYYQKVLEDMVKDSGFEIIDTRLSKAIIRLILRKI